MLFRIHAANISMALPFVAVRIAVLIQTLLWFAMGSYTWLVDPSNFYAEVGHFGIPPQGNAGSVAVLSIL